jgi:hypothetical protein
MAADHTTKEEEHRLYRAPPLASRSIEIRITQGVIDQRLIP